MADDDGIFNVGTSWLFFAAVRKNVNVPDRLEETKSIGEIFGTVGMNNVNEMSVGGVELSRFFAKQMASKKRRGRIEASDTSE